MSGGLVIMQVVTHMLPTRNVKVSPNLTRVAICSFQMMGIGNISIHTLVEIFGIVIQVDKILLLRHFAFGILLSQFAAIGQQVPSSRAKASSIKMTMRLWIE